MIKYRKPTESKNPEIIQRDAELRRLTDNKGTVFNNLQSEFARLSEILKVAGIVYDIPDIFRS